jgi:hypothetical protein
MRCFEHRDAESVGVCRSCQRGLCDACAVVVGRSLACRARCEEDVALVEDFLFRRSVRVAGAFRSAALAAAALGGALLLGGYFVATESGSAPALLGAVLALVGVVLVLAAVLWGFQAQRWSSERPHPTHPPEEREVP